MVRDLRMLLESLTVRVDAIEYTLTQCRQLANRLTTETADRTPTRADTTAPRPRAEAGTGPEYDATNLRSADYARETTSLAPVACRYDVFTTNPA